MPAAFSYSLNAAKKGVGAPGAGKMRPSALSSFPRPRVSKPFKNVVLSEIENNTRRRSVRTLKAKIKGVQRKKKNYFIKNILLYIIPLTNSSSNRILYRLPQEENRTYTSPSSSTSSVMVTQ